MALDGKLLAFVQAVGADIKSLTSGKLDATSYVRGISTFCSGKPGSSEVIGGGKSPYAFTIDATKCRATAGAAATGSTVFVIKKNDTQIGTITFAASATTGTFSFTSTAVALDDRITVTAPATADATLADIDVLIRG